MVQELQQLEAITDLSASEIAQQIEAGHLSAQEAVEAHIQRIEAVNPQLNAVVIPLFEEARAQAIEADKAQRRGEPLGPLHGVPITIKEQHRVKGTQTTLGATHQIGKIYNSEGPLVRKLRQAGAIILGKTNILQTLMGWESDNRVYGRTNNPWNRDRSPGGSSGGLPGGARNKSANQVTPSRGDRFASTSQNSHGYKNIEEIALGAKTFLMAEDPERQKWAVFQPQIAGCFPYLFHNIPSKEEAGMLMATFQQFGAKAFRTKR